MPRVTERGWSRKFDDPILLPKGQELVTLKDAGGYITRLPEHAAPDWQAAMEALLLVVELDVRSHRHHAGAYLRPSYP
jgi:hypothetical protein